MEQLYSIAVRHIFSKKAAGASYLLQRSASPWPLNYRGRAFFQSIPASSCYSLATCYQLPVSQASPHPPSHPAGGLGTQRCIHTVHGTYIHSVWIENMSSGTASSSC